MPKDLSLSRLTRPKTENLILDALPDAEYQRLLPDLEPVKPALGEVIYRPEEPIEYVYFPQNAMISVIASTAQGQSAEVGVIGFEGMTGMEVLMGSDSTLNENIVQHSANALRIKTAAIRKEFKRCGNLNDSLLSFTRLLMIQIGQTALCNRLHTLDERLARWLLVCRDRAKTDELQLTQEFLSIMLGTNRANVTMSAIALQSTGYIKYRRGQITITDGAGLQNFACDCYRTVKRQYDPFQNHLKIKFSAG